MRGRSRAGITLVELIVVIGVIGLLVALTVPAVLAAREAARRAQCLGNLKQIGLGIHQYEATFGCLPPGRIKTYDPRYAGPNPPCSSRIIDKSYEVSILPFVEQGALYNAINQSLTIVGAENSTIHAVNVGIYACPSDFTAGPPRDLKANALAPYGAVDPPGGRHRMARTSYAACAGSVEVDALPLPDNGCRPAPAARAQNDGCFHDLAPVTLAAVSDGLGQTLFVLERATAPLQEVDAFRPGEFAAHGWWVTGNWGDSIATTFYPPNAYKTVSLAATLAQFNAGSSLHPGGLNVLMGDGSARFVRETIQTWPFRPISGNPAGARQVDDGPWTNLPAPGVWQALATRAGGEGIPGELSPPLIGARAAGAVGGAGRFCGMVLRPKRPGGRSPRAPARIEARCLVWHGNEKSCSRR